MTINKNILVKQFFRIFILWLIPLCGVLVYVFFLEYSKSVNNLKNKETLNIILAQRAIKDVLIERVSDLSTITRLLKLHTETELYSRHSEHIKDELVAISETKGIYDQIRLLDLTGNELIRINLQKEQAHITPTQQLQNKKERYYFKETLALVEGEVFISPLDLNIEHGKIEQPIKPIIRLGTPLYNLQGEKSGILIINFLAQNLLNKLLQSTGDHPVSLLNAQGYWLMHSDDNRTWGFMYDNGERFQKYHHDIWTTIMEQDMGQIDTLEGIMSFGSIYPLLESSTVLKNTVQTANNKLQSKAYIWKVTSFLPKAKLQSIRYEIIFKIICIILPLLVVIFFISLRLAYHRLKRIDAEHALKLSNHQLEDKVRKRTQALQHEVEIRQQVEEKMRYMASYDALTDIPNRALLNERLLNVMAMTKRYKYYSALLFIDLDGFKSVNDRFGHKVGDLLLKQVSQRITQTIRDSDTVGRYGGDEFVVLLHEIHVDNDAVFVANEIIQALSVEFLLEENVVNIGCSIGISIYRGEDISAGELITQADEAMYEIKKAGKNGFKLAGK